MEPHAAVRRRDTLPRAAPPRSHDAVDRARVDPRPVAEDDDRGLRLGAERRESAPKRRPWPSLPLRAVHDAGARLDVVRPEDDDDLVDGGALPHPLNDRLEQHVLLR
jgi:hypothetical protein